MWPFRHMSMESMSVLATAMNEAMLQSYDGIIRVFPAFPSNRSCRFTLHAEGGFIVSSEIKTGTVQWISVKSLYGNTMKLELPWGRATKKSYSSGKSLTVKEKTAEIKTKPGEVILIVKEGISPDSWLIKGEEPSANENVKYHSSGKTRLGIPRMF
jgi:alpha-L-fucosidase 2